jgi:hypothetical protein
MLNPHHALQPRVISLLLCNESTFEVPLDGNSSLDDRLKVGLRMMSALAECKPNYALHPTFYARRFRSDHQGSDSECNFVGDVMRQEKS